MTRKFAVGGPETRHGNARTCCGRQVRLVPILQPARWCVLGCLWAIAASSSCGQEAPVSETQADAAAKTPPAMLQPAEGWLRVTKDYDVWVDYKQKQVIAGGRICLREGLLEMFACPKGTKEHESIVSVNTPARFVHAALVALGAQPGPPVQFEPTYKPAQGTEVVVEVLWKDEHGDEQRVRAQQWVKHLKTGQELEYPWVFAGSGFWTDEAGKEQFYCGDGGEFVCVSNFSTATLDLPIESSAANDTLMFAAFTERIPPRDTPVLLILTPKLEKTANGTQPTEPAAQKDEARTEPEPAATDTPDTAKAPAAEPAKEESGKAEPAKAEPGKAEPAPAK